MTKDVLFAEGDPEKVALLQDLLGNGQAETCPDGQAHLWRLGGMDLHVDKPATYTWECKRCRGARFDMTEAPK